MDLGTTNKFKPAERLEPGVQVSRARQAATPGTAACFDTILSVQGA